MSLALRPCPSCAQMVFTHTCTCPHCGQTKVCRTSGLPAAGLLLGLTLAAVGCSDKGTADYSAVATTDRDTEDRDDDGYSEDDGDCDDTDPEVNPGAEEIVGDDKDSNCNGDPDT